MTRHPAWLPHDEPNQRSLHQTPVPRGGGLAVMAGAVAGGMVFINLQVSILLGIAIALSAISFWDDWRSLSAFTRLMTHFLAAVAFIWSFLSGTPLLSLVLIGVLIAWMTNLYNFMDGSDGLAGGMAVCGFGAYCVAAWQAGEGDMALISVGLAASSLGFLLFNFPPARLFLGDVGSIPLGFLAGAIGSLGWHRAVWPAWFPLLVFAPFILDASVTLVRRLLRREKVWQAHRSHFYQRLVRLGWGHRKTALAEYALMIGGALLALLALDADAGHQFMMLAGAAAIYVVLMALIDLRWRSAKVEAA
ncbi:MAG: glycosyl transferase family protein [Betaproteobacteria bacterium]|nr:glycosyl transferase family protein [Betaproteobacteria bacterium]